MTLHSRSCLADAFAHVVGVPVLNLVHRVGVNCIEDGFHIQELMEAVGDDWLVEDIHRNPRKVNPTTMEIAKCRFGNKNEEQRFAIALALGPGVVMGNNRRGSTHAVAWDANNVTDLSTGEHYPLLRDCSGPFSLLEVNDGSFTPQRFLRLRRKARCTL
jgi:hypothetical protein